MPSDCFFKLLAGSVQQTDEEKNLLYIGHVVLSFGAAPMVPKSNDINNEQSLILVFALSKSSPHIIKMHPKMIDTVLDELLKSCQNLSIVDQREHFERLLDTADEVLITNLMNHPFMGYFGNRPDMTVLPPSIWEATSNQYATFIHLNAYPDFFKFDVTFLNKDVVRYTLPSSLVPLLIELLQNTKDLSENIRRSIDVRSS